MSYEAEKREIIRWAKILNERGFVSGCGGNISLKVSEDAILITAHEAYLGFLEPDEILLLSLDGEILEGKKSPTVEKEAHIEIHKEFKEQKVVIHAHSPFTVAYFSIFYELKFFSFEAKLFLGKVPKIPQNTPTIGEIPKIKKALLNSNIIVLENHGVISIGKSFKEAFSLVELLEEQAKIGIFTKIYEDAKKKMEKDLPKVEKPEIIKYKLLSKEHIERLKEIVNGDKQAQDLGKRYNLTCTIAIKNLDTGDVARFVYKEGKIIETDKSEDADFLIYGKEEMLKKIFNREIDPFVAAAQKKVKTKGDFSKMSKWYPVLVRTFKLWEMAPVI